MGKASYSNRSIHRIEQTSLDRSKSHSTTIKIMSLRSAITTNRKLQHCSQSLELNTPRKPSKALPMDLAKTYTQLAYQLILDQEWSRKAMWVAIRASSPPPLQTYMPMSRSQSNNNHLTIGPNQMPTISKTCMHKTFKCPNRTPFRPRKCSTHRKLEASKATTSSVHRTMSTLNSLLRHKARKHQT